MIYDEAEDIARRYGDYKTYLFGHIHAPFVKRYGDRLFANAGSVGSPLDRDHRASYAVVAAGAGAPKVDIRRVPYDLEAHIRSLDAVPWHERIVEILRSAYI